MNSRIPPQLDVGKTSESCISYLHYMYEAQQKCIDNGEALITDCAARYVCGLPVPDFQRPLVWTPHQNIAFIESAWLGISLGTYSHHAIRYQDLGKATHFSGWLIDGQQRLNAIEQYWNDKFSVFGLKWSELTNPEKRRFMSVKFVHHEPDLWSDAKIREAYNRNNFGGTAHNENERA